MLVYRLVNGQVTSKTVDAPADIMAAMKDGWLTSPPQGAATAGNKATLYGPNGQAQVVDVGSTQASQLQSQGWGLTPGSYKVPTATTTGAGTQTPTQTSGSGTSTPTNTQTSGTNTNTQTSGSGTNTNVSPVRGQGQYFPVKFASDPTPGDGTDNSTTVYLYDAIAKTYRPFMSWNAYKAYFPGIPDATLQSKIYNIIPSSLSSTDWQGTFLGYDQAVQNDGSIPGGTGNNTSGGGNKYGQQADTDLEAQTKEFLKRILDKAGAQGALNPNTMSKYVNATNSTWLNGAIDALAYGSYTVDDVLKDLKAKELFDGGNTQYGQVKGFSPTMPALTWKDTLEGKTAATNAGSLAISAGSIGLPDDLFNLPIFKIPDSAYQMLVKPVDWTSQESQAEAEKIHAAYYDIMMQQAQATTEQAKAIADSNYELFKTNLKKSYNIELSNSAREAWNQISSMVSGASNRNIGNSGILDYAMDHYLSDVRRGDQIKRESNKDTENLEYRDWLLNSANPGQIKDAITKMNNEDAAQGLTPDKYRSVTWGIVPSDENKKFFSDEELKKKFPELTPQEIAQYKNSLIDENGNYRSKLYQTMYTNQLNLGEAKKTYQQQELFRQKTLADDQSKSQVTQNNPFTSYNATNTGTGTTQANTPQTPVMPTTTPKASSSNSSTQAAANAAANAANNVTKPATSTPAATTPAPTTTTPTTTTTTPKPTTTTTTPTPSPVNTKLVTIKHKSGGTQQVYQSDYDNYWKSQGWSL